MTYFAVFIPNIELDWKILKKKLYSFGIHYV